MASGSRCCRCALSEIVGIGFRQGCYASPLWLYSPTRNVTWWNVLQYLESLLIPDNDEIKYLPEDFYETFVAGKKQPSEVSSIPKAVKKVENLEADNFPTLGDKGDKNLQHKSRKIYLKYLRIPKKCRNMQLLIDWSLHKQWRYL